MIKNLKIGTYLVDKQYKDTIFKITDIEDNYYDNEPGYCILTLEGKDENCGVEHWFREKQLDMYFFEIEYNTTAKTLYGKSKVQNRG